MLDKRAIKVVKLPILATKPIKSRWEVKNNLVRLGEVLEDLPDNRFAVSL